MVIWVIGLAGAGKSTIARQVVDARRAAGRPCILIDGDLVREVMGDDLGHALDDRRRNGWRIARLCRMLDAQGIDVVCAILSLFSEHQQFNRDNIPSYLEVFVDVEMSELERRDQKGLYSGARAGTIVDVAGVDLHFPRPDAHLTVHNTAPDDLPRAVAAVLHEMEVR